jgi:O-antigen ligase
MNDRKQRELRFLWLLPMLLMGVALACTHSRGGLLAAAGGGFAWFMIRYGRKRAIAVALAGMCLLPLIAGRQAEIDLSEGTAQSRIQLWSDGLAQIQSPNIAFGIGQGMYQEFAQLVAHNSYVHAYVELGFFGGTLFFGCFFFAALGLYRLDKIGEPLHHAELRRLHPYMAALTAGWGVGLLSLSRCYVAPTYMVVGVVGVYLQMAGLHLRPCRPLIVWNRRHLQKLVVGSGAALVCCMLFVRLFARWS